MSLPVVRPSFIFLVLLLLALGLSGCSGNLGAPVAIAPTNTTVAQVDTPIAPPADTPTPVDTTAPISETQTGAASTNADAALAAPDLRTFRLDQTRSQARFYIDEVLMGSPKTVVGATELVDGELTINSSAPAETTLGTITIDVSDLQTDSGMRDRAIRNFVLQSGREEYKYVTFAPTAIEGLPERAQPGDQLAFVVSGDLQIRDIVQPVRFEVALTIASDAELHGLASTVIPRAAFELTIPDVPSVSAVADEVKLELEFVAVAE